MPFTLSITFRIDDNIKPWHVINFKYSLFIFKSLSGLSNSGYSVEEFEQIAISSVVRYLVSVIK